MEKFQKMRERKIVFTNGVFDLFHPGHVEFLNFCQEQCRPQDTLFVGINSDASVRRLKGQGRPIMSHVERKKMVRLLADAVEVFEEDTPIELIRRLKPDILVKGSEWQGKVVGQEFVERYGGKVILYDRVTNYSTTDIIKRCYDSYRKAENEQNQGSSQG